jgi:hypothetical protein
MAIRSFTQDHKERARITFNVPAKSGDYANERITFGAVGSGTYAQSFVEVTALAETLVTGATVELWLPQVPDPNVASDARTDANYYNSTLTPLTTQGAVVWATSAWPGAQIRVKSGGVAGAMTVSASSY